MFGKEERRKGQEGKQGRGLNGQKTGILVRKRKREKTWYPVPADARVCWTMLTGKEGGRQFGWGGGGGSEDVFKGRGGARKNNSSINDFTQTTKPFPGHG